MTLHKEINLEAEICAHLAAHGWLYAEGDAAICDRARALFAEDVLAWVQAAQPQAWQTLTKNHGAQAGETLLKRVRDQIDQRGRLDVLRHGVELLGLRQPLKLAEFKPALAMNPDILNAIISALDAHSSLSSAGAEFGGRAGRDQGHPAEPFGAVGSAARDERLTAPIQRGSSRGLA